MASAKKLESSQRLRYVRLLERFCNSMVSYLSKSEHLSKEQYIKRISNNARYLDRMEKVPLYKSELTELEDLVKKMREYAQSDLDIDEIASSVLNAANKLEQHQNNRRYKKDKHKGDAFKDWE